MHAGPRAYTYTLLAESAPAELCLVAGKVHCTSFGLPPGPAPRNCRYLSSTASVNQGRIVPSDSHILFPASATLGGARAPALARSRYNSATRTSKLTPLAELCAYRGRDFTAKFGWSGAARWPPVDAQISAVFDVYIWCGSGRVEGDGIFARAVLSEFGFRFPAPGCAFNRCANSGTTRIV